MARFGMAAAVILLLVPQMGCTSNGRGMPLGKISYFTSADGTVGVKQFDLVGVSLVSNTMDRRLVLGRLHGRYYYDLRRSKSLSDPIEVTAPMKSATPAEARRWSDLPCFAARSANVGLTLGMDKGLIGFRLGADCSDVIRLPVDENRLLIWSARGNEEYISLRREP